MRKRSKEFFGTLVIIFLCLMMGAVNVSAAEKKKEIFKAKPLKLKGFSQDKLSITHHTMKIGDEEISFTATAGYMPLKNEKDETVAKIFFISYTKDNVQNTAKRPLTFAFNGGPGSSSIWLHFGALGPKRVKLTPKGELPAPPYKFIDNEYTLLKYSDLVFIDPVDTGYSRAAEEKKLKDFMGVREDIISVGEFIRLYVTIFQRWRSPKYIAGESYGAIRAAGLASYLQGEMGMHLNGIIMISQALNYQVLITGEGGSDLPYLVSLPSYASTAFYHNRLSPRLQANLQATLTEVRKWTVNEYASILVKGNSLSLAEKEKAAGKLAEYTGLSKTFILDSDLRVEPFRFRKELLKDKHEILGYYDGRLTGVDPVPENSFWPPNDPTFFLGGPFATAVNDYIRNGLKFVNDIPYNLFSEYAGGKWNYDSDYTSREGFLDLSDRLSGAMNKNKYMKVFVACGYYDLCTPFYSSIYTMDHLQIAPERIKNIVYGFYQGGHMFYTNVDELKKFSVDMGKFYKESSNVEEEKKAGKQGKKK